MVNMKPASADTVRAWAAENNWLDKYDRPVKDRGRIPSDLVTAFDAAHKRNRLHYVPGYKDDNSGTQATRSSEVATRSTGRSTEATASAPAPRKNTEQAPARAAQNTRVVENEGGSGDGIYNIADAIALLTSAASARKGGRPALITVQTLVNV